MKRRILACLASLMILAVLFLPSAWATPGNYIDAEGDYYGPVRVKVYNDNGTFDRTFKICFIDILDQNDGYIGWEEGDGALLIIASYYYSEDVEFIPCNGYIGDDTKPYFTLTGISDGEGGSLAEVFIKGRVYCDKWGNPKYLKGTLLGSIPGLEPGIQNRWFMGSFRLPWHTLD